jgi:hypothetical protein
MCCLNAILCYTLTNATESCRVLLLGWMRHCIELNYDNRRSAICNESFHVPDCHIAPQIKWTIILPH